MKSTLIEHIKSSFIDTYKTMPILIFSPGRINIIGEFTDFNEGYVFPAAVNKGIVAAIQKSNAKLCNVLAVDLDEKHAFSLNKIKPLANGGWRNYVLGVVAEIQNIGKPLGSFNIAFGGNIPSGAGLSSSAALENSIVYGLNELFELGLSKKEMIFISQNAEHIYAGVKCGIMDQYASMYGQRNSALLLDCRTLKSIPFKIDFGNYQLLLIDTNVKHNLSESAYNERRLVCERIVNLLNIKSLRDATCEQLLNLKSEISKEDYQKALYVIQENQRVLQASKAIKENDLSTLGTLLYASHKGLQTQFKVSCDELDFLIEKAKENPNILGARMMGGGFGGCTINLIAKNNLELFKKTVSEAYKNKFSIACSIYNVTLSDGTQVVKN